MLRDRAGWGVGWGGVGCLIVRGMLITLLMLRVQSVWLQVMRRWSPGDINVYICTYIYILLTEMVITEIINPYLMMIYRNYLD